MYKAKEQMEILRELLANAGASTSAFEGSFQYDVLASNAIEFNKTQIEIEILYKLLFAHTSWGEFLSMVTEQYGVTRREATHAIGEVTVKGNGIVVAGNIFATRKGLNFEALETKEIKGETTIKVQAVEPGKIGNVAAGEVNQIPMSIPGINSVSNSQPMVDGYDEETDEELRERYLYKVRNPITSGNKNHYEYWAKQIQGVGAAKCIPLWNGPGTVKLIITDKNLGTAPETLLTRVKNHIEAEKPIGATLTITSARPKTINIKAIIRGNVNQDDFKKSVEHYFNSIGFKEGGALYVSIAKIGKLLLEMPGVLDYDTITLNNSAGNVQLTEEELPIIGEVVINASSTA